MNQIAPAARVTKKPAATLARAWLDEALVPARLLRQRQPLIDWLSFRSAAQTTDQAREHLAAIGSANLLEGVMLFHRAATEEASEAQTDLAVAVLTDGFPNARPVSPVGYADALRFTVDDKCFSAAVLAAAVQRIWRESKFVPAPAEVLAMCTRVRREFSNASDALERGYDLKCAAEDLLVEAGEMKIDDDGNVVPVPKEGCQ